MYLYESQGVRFQDEPRNWPDAEYKLNQAVKVLRSDGSWTLARVAFVHNLGNGFVYTVRVDLDDLGSPRLKQFRPASELRAS